MILVISHAWTKDDGPSADAYVEHSRAFLSFMQAQEGFVGRSLVRSVEDRTHFTHLRWFESAAAYEALTRRPGYQDQIARLSAHLDLGKYEGRAGRELMELVLEDGGAGGAAGGRAPGAATRSSS